MHILIAALHRPIQPTGVCRHAANLAHCLAENKEVTRISLVIGSWQQHYFKAAFSLDSEKIKLIIVNIKNSSVVRNSWFLSGLPQLANNLGSDIVHLSFPFPFFRASFNAYVVTTIHDLYPYECPENFGFPQAWFNRLFFKQCISNSDGLACVSQVTLEKLKVYFPHLDPHKEIDVIYNYVDFERFKPKIPQQLPKNSSFLLSVAQHRQNKNLDLLIKAYSWLLDNKKLNPDAKLVIVGTSGPETQNIKNLISDLSLETKVVLLAAIDDSELCWLYQNCQAFVIPSSTEGFCLPLAEALYWSNTIVCSDIPIFREIGTYKCTYFSLEDDAVNNLGQAIIQSINRSILSSYTNVFRFEKSNIAKQYLNLYSKLNLEGETQFLKNIQETDKLTKVKFIVTTLDERIFIQIPERLSVFEAVNLKQICQEITQIETSFKEIIIDFYQTIFMDSSGLGALISIWKTAQAKGVIVLFKNVTPQVLAVLSLTGLDTVFSIKSSFETHFIATDHALDKERAFRMNKDQLPTTHLSVISWIKRFIDVIGALVGLIITGIVFIPVVVAIQIDDPGPIFFSQIRCGWMGKKFRIWKFRSMCIDAEVKKSQVKNQVQGAFFKNEQDPRVTRVGKFIRRTSIDELPQFWNVLKGDMSLVGTRPPTPDEVEHYEVPQWQRLDIKPGMTGEWQVNGRSRVRSFEDVIRMDLSYQQNWSLMYDLKLIVKTFAVLFTKNSGAY